MSVMQRSRLYIYMYIYKISKFHIHCIYTYIQVIFKFHIQCIYTVYIAVYIAKYIYTFLYIWYIQKSVYIIYTYRHPRLVIIILHITSYLKIRCNQGNSTSGPLVHEFERPWYILIGARDVICSMGVRGVYCSFH